MDTRADISVIIPVYNAEKYIERCLESIFCQSFENIEVICVDDGSFDATKDIIARKQKEDNRLRVIDYGTNKGQAYARNRGLEAANGKYVYYMDADDTLSDGDAFKVLFETAEAEKLDCVTFDSEAVLEDAKEGERPVENLAKHVTYEGVYDGESYLQRILEYMDFKPAVWMQFWSTEFLKRNNLWFDEEISPCEDHLFTIEALCRAERVRHIDRKLHRYLCRGDSSSRKAGVQLYKANVLCYYRGIEFCRKENVKPETSLAVKEYSRHLKNNMINIGAQLVLRGEDISHISDCIKEKTLSVCMIVKNEERNIRKALEQVSVFADEIIVVDTGSNDRTMEIAAEYTDRIYQHPWQDHFGEMRNISYSYAACDYVMYFDADYEMDRESLQKLKCLKKVLTDEKSVCVNHYSTEQTIPVALHIISLRDDRKWEGAVHERIPLRKPILYADIVVRHSDERQQHFDRNIRLFSKISEREFKENYWLVAQCYSDSILAGADEWAHRFREMSKNPEYTFTEKFSPSVVAGHVLMYYKKYAEALEWFEDYLEESGRWIDEAMAARDKNREADSSKENENDYAMQSDFLERALYYDEKANGFAIKCSARIGNMERVKELNERLGRYHKDSYVYALNRLWLQKQKDN